MSEQELKALEDTAREALTLVMDGRDDAAERILKGLSTTDAWWVAEKVSRLRGIAMVVCEGVL